METITVLDEAVQVPWDVIKKTSDRYVAHKERAMETINDILKEMKSANFQPPMYQVWVNEYAVRIEAAHKREIADALNTGAFVEATRKHKRETVTDCNALNGAKCREALAELICGWDIFINGLEEDLDGHYPAHYQARRSDYEKRIHKAKSALSKPPRNCDKFSKAEVLEMLDDRSFSKEDTIEWLYETKGANDEQ